MQSQNTKKTVFDEGNILGDLNPLLRSEVVDILLRRTIGRLPLFKELTPKFRLDLFPCLKPLTRAAGEVIYLKGQTSLSLYFLVSGSITFYRNGLPTARIEALHNKWTEYVLDSDGCKTAELQTEGCFGQGALIGRRRYETAIADDISEIVLISSEDLKRLLDEDTRSEQWRTAKETDVRKTKSLSR